MTRLSKSKYISGLQCPKLLWWTVHEPGAPELVPDDSLQALFDMGHRVTAKAREAVPGGVLIELPHGDSKGRLRATREALDSGASIVYEGAFEHSGVVAVVDILERRGGGWSLVEVKSSTQVKPEHLPDAAVQQWVLQGAGMSIDRVELMHLNRECRYPDLSNLFNREDITALVDAALLEVPERVSQMKEMLEGPLPGVPIGTRCCEPYDCPFRSRCWAEVPEDSVHDLYRVGRSRAFDLWNAGVHRIVEIPSSVRLTTIQRRQKRAIKEGSLVVAARLAETLRTLKSPVAYLDFETIWPAIPVWEGMRPYDQAAAQVSVHVEQEDGSLAHHEWLAEGCDDPRATMAQKIVEFTRESGSIVVYNVAFERARLREMIDRFPDLAQDLSAIDARLWDLLPVVRNHVYHPDFNGSFSIKSVLPALVPGKNYDALEIAEGGAASRMLERLLLDSDLAGSERARIRKALRAYCAMDTRTMFNLLTRLRELAAAAQDISSREVQNRRS